ncbi:Hsp20/alpha crystallin family protein [Naasia sp. SYSU D00948]|uniref:Hsp20/alpha crystallin family protein n=1 Tax=Naasia sp. SYSU D00948 TaxID=2817379 RepID=UPI001B3048DA|nr:Hsp20/alpha crystallin family protein [Naasia sp. SYSU D00948]
MAMFFDPFQELDRATGALFRSAGSALMPVDLYREGDHFVLTADLPGVDPGSVDVSVDGQTLTIRAERTVGAGEGVQWLTRERPDASYLRQFTLGNGIDADRIDASYDNGVLSITIPVAEAAKPRKIQIGTASEAARHLPAGRDAEEHPERLTEKIKHALKLPGRHEAEA